MSHIEGIVLNELQYKESSKILNIYTKELGKINVMAKGAYRSKSKLIASTQAFSYCNYEFRSSRTFYYLLDGRVIKSFYNIREKIERTMIGFYILEIFNKSIPEEEPNETLFLFLVKALDTLSNLDENFLEFLIAFELKFISFIGYRPNIKECVSCGKKNIKNLRFSIESGGILCEDCIEKDIYSKNISEEFQNILIKLMYAPFDNIKNISFEKKDLIVLQDIVEKYVLYYVEREEFNSLNMLKSIL